MKRFNLFGLSVLADIPLGATCTENKAPDLVIKEGLVPLVMPSQMTRLTPCVAHFGEQLWYRIPGLIRVQLKPPNQIIWFEEKVLLKELVSELLLETLIPTVLQSNRYIVRSGFGLCNKEQGLLVIGCSQATLSKASTTLVDSGLQFLCDGLCAAQQCSDGSWDVYPGIPRIRYLNTRKGEITYKARRLRDHVGIYIADALEHFSSEPKPLKGILFVTYNEGKEETSITSLKGLDRLQFFNTGRTLLDTEYKINSKAINFRDWAELSKSVPFFTLNIIEEDNQTQSLVAAISEILA